jgi:DUF917 family protein
MPRLITTVQEVEDLVRGVTFFGTGGGGNPDKGLHLIPIYIILWRAK